MSFINKWKPFNNKIKEVKVEEKETVIKVKKTENDNGDTVLVLTSDDWRTLGDLAKALSPWKVFTAQMKKIIITIPKTN